jgi:hypothetical protein
MYLQLFPSIAVALVDTPAAGKKSALQMTDFP